MHVSEASAPHLHLRNAPVKSSANDGQTESNNATPQFHVAASVISSPVLQDTIAPNVVLADTTHENVTPKCTRLRPYNPEVTPGVIETGLKLAQAQPCISCGELGPSNHLKIPSTRHRRRDSVHKSSVSSDGDDDSVLDRLTPPESGSRPLSRNQEVRANTGLCDWSSPTRWRTRTRLRISSTPPLIGDWTTSGAEAPSELDELEYDEDKFILNTFSSHESTQETIVEAQRPYTSSLGDTSFLGIPNCRNYPSDSDVISDAGNQQELHQKHADGQGTSDENELEQFFASLHVAEGCQALQSKLLEALQRTWNPYGHDQEFLPKGELYRLINAETVAQVLKKELSRIHTPERIRQLAGRVCSETRVTYRGKKKIKTFRKIFALLVISEYTSSISLFLDEDVSDLDLPLISINSKGKKGFCRKATSGKPLKTPLKCFQHDDWSSIKLRNFQEYQWKLLAPFFARDDDGDIKHYVLHDQHILPFVPPHNTEEEDADRTGGSGKVFMVRIHSDHHNFQDERLSHRGFAVKQQLYDTDREAFKKETLILKSFSGERSHRHIVSLLATYEQFRKFHLVFYRAEGDLFTYWKEIHPRRVLSCRSVTWVAEQCAGIAEALLRLHRHLTAECQADAMQHTSHSRAKSIDQQMDGVDSHDYIIDPFTKRVQSCDSLERPASPVVSDRPLWPLIQPIDGEQLNNQHPVALADTDMSGRLPNNNHGGIGARKHARKHARKQADFDETASNPDQQIHEKKYGRHGDINPGNILWYDDCDTNHDDLKGTLKLADFGQAELNTLLSRTQPRDVANTLTYRPPECDLQPKIVRQSYDIWCLGCVYLEFVTWVLGGESLLLSFSQKRLTPDMFQNNHMTDTFFQIVRDQETGQPGVMIKKAVTLFIDELHEHQNCTDYLHDFLDIIQHEMLVLDSAERAFCADISRRLKRMHNDCSHKEGYVSDMKPWCIKREPMPRSFRLEMSRRAERVIVKNLPLRHVPLAPQRKLLHEIKK